MKKKIGNFISFKETVILPMRYFLLFISFLHLLNLNCQERVFKAIEEGSIDILKTYVAKGKDLNIVTEKQAETLSGNIHKDKLSLLEWAVVKRQYDAIDLLLEYKDNFERLEEILGRSLCIAASTGDLNVTEKLVTNGADVNFRSTLFDSLNPTYISLLYTNLNTFFYLIENGGDINLINSDELSLLHQAAFVGVKKVAELLIENGLNPLQKDKNGRTPIMYAAWSGNYNNYNLLLQHGALWNDKSELNESVFLFSVISGNIFIVKDLMEKGVAIDEPDILGNSPLFYAVIHEKPALVKMLINRGADVNRINTNSMTPLTYALMKSNQEIVVELIENGAKVRKEEKELIKKYFSSKSMRKYLKNEYKKNK